METDWLLSPHQGIGRLTFGLSPQEVAALSAVYGAPGPLMSQEHVAADIEAVIAQLGDIPAGDIAAMRQAAQEVANLATQTLEGHAPVLLEYRDRRLDGVSVAAGHQHTHYQGLHVFALGAQDVLALFERANGAPGRYRSTEAAFDHIAVSLHGFSATSARREIRATAATEREFRERAITLRSEPYRPSDEMDQFTSFSFL